MYQFDFSKSPTYLAVMRVSGSAPTHTALLQNYNLNLISDQKLNYIYIHVHYNSSHTRIAYYTAYLTF